MSFESWNLNQKLQGVWDTIIGKCEPAVRQAGYWMCTCPAHPERTPSLEVKPSPDGDKVLLKCQAGCETADVLRVLGVEWWELFATPKPDEKERVDEEEDVPTVVSLATAKGLPVQFLQELGCKDVPNGVLIPYKDEAGKEATFRIRTRITGKPKYVTQKGGKVAVYGADRLPGVDQREGKSLILVEGETDCWTLWHHDVIALGISSSTHTKTLLKRHVEGFAAVYVVREPDSSGDRFVKGIVGRLYHHGYGGAVAVVSFGPAKDPSGLHLDVEGDRERFRADLRDILGTGEPVSVQAVTHEAAGDEKERVGKEKKPDQTTDLFLLGTEHAEIVLDEVSGLAVARVVLDGERIDCVVKSGTFTNWLMRSYLSKTGKPVLRANLDNAVNNIAAAYTRKVKTYCRVARVENVVYYDLCSGGKVVRIDKDGWRVLDESPVYFLRGADMAPQVTPVPSGDVADLSKLVNVPRDEFPLLLAFLVDSLKGRKPYLFGSVHGGQGQGKSWLLSVVKGLIDPSKVAEGLAIPKSESDLYVLARHRFLMDFDNVSRIGAAMSDALCRLSTGSGAATRTLYTNGDETVFGGANPCLFNGIPDFLERPDLQGRTVSLILPKITDAGRRSEADLKCEYTRLKPGILGALFSLVANGLANLNTVKTDGGPRMMDSFLWLKACEAGAGLKLADAYKEHVEGALADHAMNDPMVQTLVVALDVYRKNTPKAGYKWTGTAAELYDLMKPQWATDTRKEENQIPGNGQVLSNRLMMLSEPLSRIGIDVSKGRTGWRGRFLVLEFSRYFATPKPDEKEKVEKDEAAGEAERELQAEVVTKGRPAPHQEVQPGQRVRVHWLPANRTGEVLFSENGTARVKLVIPPDSWCTLSEGQRQKLRLTAPNQYLADVELADIKEAG